MIYNADWLIENGGDITTQIDSRWVACRPCSGTFRFEKIKSAWEVLRGRADALKWTGQEK